MDSLDDDAADSDNVKFQCERDWRQLRDIQAELQNSAPVTPIPGRDDDINCASSNTLSLLQILQEHEKRLKAELQAIRERELKTLPDSAGLRLLILEQDQITRLDQLRDTLVYSRAVRSDVLEEIKQEEEACSSLSSLNDALKTKMTAVEQVEAAHETGGIVESVLTEMTSKVNKVKEANKYFKNILKGVLSQHFPLPHHKGAGSTHGKSRDTDMGNMLSLKSIVGMLIEQSLNSPEQPYIDIDDRFWPPHIEFLHRYQIVLKDPQNSHRMKLVPFHL